MCDKDSGESYALREHRSLADCSRKGDVLGTDQGRAGRGGLRAGVFCARSPLRLLQRTVLHVRTDCRAERQPWGMHPGLPVTLRPRGRGRERSCAKQSLAVTQGLQPQRQAGGSCGSGNMFVQDRGTVEEHLLRAECREGIFIGIGRVGRSESGKIPQGLVRKVGRRFHT